MTRVQFTDVFSLYIDLVGKLQCPVGYIGKEHSHVFWEMIVTTKDFKRCEITVIPPNKEHFFQNSGDTEYYMVYIGFSIGQNNMSPSDVRERIENILATKAVFAQINDIIKYAFGDDFDEKLFMKKTMLLLFGIYDTLVFEGDYESGNRNIVTHIKEYIHANINKTLTVSEVAESFYFSPKYLGTVFKKETGLGILQYQKKIKMEKALSFLHSGQYSVKEVASLLGYDNVQYFSNSFKGYYGISPSEIKKKL